MPARGDHDERRAAVSEAVWRVVAASGFGGLTLRAIAAEMNASTGLLTHYFPTKRALVQYALDVADDRTANRVRRVPKAAGIDALRAALLDVLCLTPEDTAMNRVWVTSWDPALGDPELSAQQAARYVRWRDRLRPHAEAAQRNGELPEAADPAELVALAAAVTHGIVVQALFDPEAFPPDRQIALIDRFLDGLTTANLPRTDT